MITNILSELIIVYIFLFIWTVYEANKKTETIAVKRTVKYLKQNLETLDSQPNATPIEIFNGISEEITEEFLK